MDVVMKSESEASLLTPESGVSIAQVEPPMEEPRRPQVVQPIEEVPRGRTLAVERVIVRHSEEIDQLFGAMAAAQGQFEDLDRTRTARIESSRAKYTYDYETLADVIVATRKGLSENGLSVWQFPFPGQHSVVIRTLIGHKSGQWVYNDLTASIAGTDPQSIASGITYLCRYARKAILGIAAGWDDDGAAASLSPASAPPQPAQRRSQQSASEPVTPKLSAVSVPPVGTITELSETANGYMGQLDSGFVFGVTNPELQKAVLGLRKESRCVELRCRPSRDPARFAPILEEILPLMREPGEDG